MNHSLRDDPPPVQDALTNDELHALDRLARDVLREAASAPDSARAETWAEAACACLQAVCTCDLRMAGYLFDRTPHDAPFVETWRTVTAPIAARAEAIHLIDIERDVERQAERLARP